MRVVYSDLFFTGLSYRKVNLDAVRQKIFGRGFKPTAIEGLFHNPEENVTCRIDEEEESVTMTVPNAFLLEWYRFLA